MSALVPQLSSLLTCRSAPVDVEPKENSRSNKTEAASMQPASKPTARERLTKT